MIELHVAGRHDRALADEFESLQRKARQAMDNIWLDLFSATGISRKDAKHIVEMTDHFFRGVALLACIQTRAPNAKEIEPWTAALIEPLDRAKWAKSRSILSRYAGRNLCSFSCHRPVVRF